MRKRNKALGLLGGCVFSIFVANAAGAATDEADQLKRWTTKADRQHALLIREALWVIPASCLPKRDLGDASQGRDLGDASAGRDLGDASQGRDLGDASQGRDLGDASAGRDLGDASQGRDLGDASAGRDLGDASEGRDLGDASAGRDLGDASQGRDLGDDSSALRCQLGELQESVIIHGASWRDMGKAEGSRLHDFRPGPVENSVRVIL